MAELAVFDKDPNIYLFTSLTAGSSHIITATSRIETILKANKIPFIGLDTATHELGRKLFQRRAAGKKLPLLVKEGYVLGVRKLEARDRYNMLIWSHRASRISRSGMNTTSCAKLWVSTPNSPPTPQNPLPSSNQRPVRHRRLSLAHYQVASPLGHWVVEAMRKRTHPLRAQSRTSQ